MATLWAISDLHTGHTGNKPITDSLKIDIPAAANCIEIKA